jgi:hypothetical protein
MPSRPNNPLSFRTIYAVGSGRRRFCFRNPTQEDIMSAQTIYDTVPLGSLVRYFDGTPRPPERFRRKLAAWENTNNGGRLVRKSAPHTVGTHTTPASVTLHQGDFGSACVIVLKVFKTFSVNSLLTFTVIERPKPGIVRVLNRAGDEAELLHLAYTRAAAEAWLASHRYLDAVLDEVSADESRSDRAEGRAS